MRLEVLRREAAGAVDAGDFARAEPLLLQIAGLEPRDAEAWHMLAVIACRDARPAEAIGHARHAHRLDRRNPEYLNTLAVACAEAQQLDEALRWLRRSLRENPANAQTHYNLAKALQKTGDFAAAEEWYRRALRLEPARADTLNGLASLYCRMRRFAEACPLLEQAGAAAPEDGDFAANRGLALLATQGAEAARGFLADWVARHPASTLHADLALNLLSQGRFAEGWREYAWRPRTPTAAGPVPAQRLPEDLAGRHILLLPEQGLGDHLFFLRFAPALRARGARVATVASAKCFEMLRGSPALEAVFCNGTEIPAEYAGGLALLVGDLPLMLGSSVALAPFPIQVSGERLRARREQLAALGPPPYLGVTWRAGRRNEGAEFAQRGPMPLYKDIAVEALAGAVSRWPGTVLVLQRQPAAGELAAFARALGRPVADLSALNDRLEDMAGVLALIDEYVGVSNTNMHIRAGLGAPARVLVPFPPEFRWMQSGDHSPWFPEFPLYREQPVPRGWETALERLGNDLVD